MAIQVVNEVYTHSMAREAHRLVLLTVAWYARKEDGVAWPTRATIAERAKLCEDQVRRSLRWLERIGEIRRIRPGGQDGRGDRTIYQVTLGHYDGIQPGPLPASRKGRMQRPEGANPGARRGESAPPPSKVGSVSEPYRTGGGSAPGRPEGPAPAAQPYAGPGSPAWEEMKQALRRAAQG